MTHAPTHAPNPCRRLLASWLSACSLLVALTGCDTEPVDGEQLRAAELDLEALEPGECLPLADEIASVTTGAWRIWPGVPKGIIIDDHLLLTSIFEDNVMLRVDGPASGEDDVLVVAAATVLYDDPDIEPDCGFCDGLCVDGKCLMDLPPFAITHEGICRE